MTAGPDLAAMVVGKDGLAFVYPARMAAGIDGFDNDAVRALPISDFRSAGRLARRAGATSGLPDVAPALKREQFHPLGIAKRFQLSGYCFMSRAFMASRRAPPRIVHRVNESLTQLRPIAAGLGHTLMPESALSPQIGGNVGGGVIVKPIEDAIASWDVGLVWRHDETNPAVRQFLDTARGTLRGDGRDAGDAC